MSWPWARNVLVPDGDAVTLGEAGGLAGAEAGPLGDPAGLAADAGALAGALAGFEAATAELLDELQAVTSKAAQASDAQAATFRPPRQFMVFMDFQLLNVLSGSASQVTYTTSVAAPWLEPAFPRGITTARSA